MLYKYTRVADVAYTKWRHDVERNLFVSKNIVQYPLLWIPFTIELVLFQIISFYILHGSFH